MERYARAYVDELNDFIDTVAGKRTPSVGFEDGRCALILANAAIESLRTGKAVPVKYD
jgi:myo-inositol 2-dehydrogenase/D-chiro-inositol 1-dehydrogenase